MVAPTLVPFVHVLYHSSPGSFSIVFLPISHQVALEQRCMIEKHSKKNVATNSLAGVGIVLNVVRRRQKKIRTASGETDGFLLVLVLAIVVVRGSVIP